MSGVNNFSREYQGKIYHIVVSEEKSNAISREKVVRREKVTTIEEVDKGNKNLDDTKESVVKIRRNDLDNFEGQSKVSTGWLNTDHDKKSFIHLNRNSIKNFMKRILKVKIWSHINFLYNRFILLS